MRKCVLMLILVLLNSSIFGQFGKKEGGKITVREADGTPSAADIDTVEVNNGSLTVSGNVATINIVAAAGDSSFNFVTFVATDGDTNSIRAKTDGTLNAYATQGFGFRARKSTATYPFIFSMEALGGAGDSASVMDAAGRWGIRTTPQGTAALSIKSTGTSWDTYIFDGQNSSGTSKISCTSAGALSVSERIFTPKVGGYGATSADIVVDCSSGYGIGLVEATTRRLYVKTGGNIEIGNSTVADQQSPDLVTYNDADLDPSATTTEALTISLTANADPTLVRWNFASTQGRGYRFDKNIYLQSDSTADHDIFVGNATFSRMNAGDANFTTSSSATLKENFQEIDKPNLDSLKFYTYTWKKEALGWVDLKTIPDSVTTFSWSVDTLQDGTFDSTQVFWKIPNPEKKIHADINAKAEARAKELQYGMKSEDWDSKADRADSKSINWQEVAIKFYRLVLDHETKIKDLETRVSKLEGK